MTERPAPSRFAQSHEPMTTAEKRIELGRARDLVEWGCETLNILTPVKVVFSASMTRCMGKASGPRAEIRLSAPLWLRATPEERDETIVHELAHIIDFLRNNGWRKGTGGKRLVHDQVFKAIVQSLGGEGSRCHKVDTSGLKRRRAPRRSSVAAQAVTVLLIPRSGFNARSEFRVGDRVLFGRRNGEQTEGVIVKLNAKKAKVRQVGARGVRSNHAEGTVWGVPYSLLTKITA